MAKKDRQAVLITGASTGIGRACALHLDHLGFKVFAGYRKDVDADSLRRAASDRLEPVRLDVADSSSIEATVETVRASVGDRGLFALINNAGVVVAAPLEFLSLENLRNQFEVNVVAQISMVQSFLPLLTQGEGRVVMMGSIGGRVAWPFLGPYCASKFALEALTDSLRLEMRKFGIPVTIVEPGNVDTPIWKKSLAEAEQTIAQLPEEAQKRYGSSIDVLKRAVRGVAGKGVPPEKVARTVARLLAARRPGARRLLGWDAKLLVAMRRYLPVRVSDWIILRVLLRDSKR